MNKTRDKMSVKRLLARSHSATKLYLRYNMVGMIFTITDITYWQKHYQNKKQKNKNKNKQKQKNNNNTNKLEKNPTELFLEILFYWHCATSTTFEYSSS
jgi:uncharacterized membrane protein YebE (DUF533 family)